MVAPAECGGGDTPIDVRWLDSSCCFLIPNALKGIGSLVYRGLEDVSKERTRSERHGDGNCQHGSQDPREPGRGHFFRTVLGRCHGGALGVRYATCASFQGAGCDVMRPVRSRSPS